MREWLSEHEEPEDAGRHLSGHGSIEENGHPGHDLDELENDNRGRRRQATPLRRRGCFRREIAGGALAEQADADLGDVVAFRVDECSETERSGLGLVEVIYLSASVSAVLVRRGVACRRLSY